MLVYSFGHKLLWCGERGVRPWETVPCRDAVTPSTAIVGASGGRLGSVYFKAPQLRTLSAPQVKVELEIYGESSGALNVDGNSTTAAWT